MGFTGMFSVETVLKIIAYGVKVSTQATQLKPTNIKYRRVGRDHTDVTNVLFLLTT